MLSFLFLLTDLLDGSGQVYSLEFGCLLSYFPLHLFKVHLEGKKNYSKVKKDRPEACIRQGCTSISRTLQCLRVMFLNHQDLSVSRLKCQLNHFSFLMPLLLQFRYRENRENEKQSREGTKGLDFLSMGKGVGDRKGVKETKMEKRVKDKEIKNRGRNWLCLLRIRVYRLDRGGQKN